MTHKMTNKVTPKITRRLNKTRAVWSVLAIGFFGGTATMLFLPDDAGSATPPKTAEHTSDKASEKTREKAPTAESSGSPNAQASPGTQHATETAQTETYSKNGQPGDIDHPVHKEDQASPIGAIQEQRGCLVEPAALEDIKRSHEDLEIHRKELASREADLKARERVLDAEFKKLGVLREDISKQNSAVTKENEEKISRLVETFETMSPKSAAQVLSSIDEGLAVTAFNRMSTQKLAKIMSAMEPDRSKRLTELLAGVAKFKSNNGKGGEGNDANQHKIAESTTGSKVQREPGSEKSE